MTIDSIITDAILGANGKAQQKIAETGLGIVNLLLRKNMDYGGSAFRAPLLMPTAGPAAGILCRMSDKIERLSHLFSGASGGAKVDESAEDTMRDLAGYAILYLTLLAEAESGE